MRMMNLDNKYILAYPGRRSVLRSNVNPMLSIFGIPGAARNVGSSLRALQHISPRPAGMNKKKTCSLSL